MLPLDKHAQFFTVTSSSDLRLRGQRPKKVKLKITLNGKTNGVNMLALGKDAKVSIETSLCDLRLRDQWSNKVKFQIRNQYKDVYQYLLADTDLYFFLFPLTCSIIRIFKLIIQVRRALVTLDTDIVDIGNEVQRGVIVDPLFCFRVY